MKLTDPADIAGEIQKLYKNLLGYAAVVLPKDDIPLLKSGSRLSPDVAHALCMLVTTAKIDRALKFLDDSKAPDLDGYNVVFFRNTWHIIKEDVYSAMMYFFHTGKMYSGVNCICITLASAKDC